MTADTSFAAKPTLHGERVTLRPIVADDAEAMFADLDDAEATRLTGTHDTFTYEQIERWCAGRADTDDRLDLAVVDPATGEWFGEVVVLELDADNRSCSFRIALGPNARNRGIGTEATQLIVDHVFGEHPGMNRIELTVYDFNPRARKVYEKVGFVAEGVRRQALWWDGEPHDAIDMGLLRSDWEQGRRG